MIPSAAQLPAEDLQEVVMHRPGLGTVYRIRFGAGLVVHDEDEDGQVSEQQLVRERLLVVQHDGRETWTNNEQLAADMLGQQYTLF